MALSRRSEAPSPHPTPVPAGPPTGGSARAPITRLADRARVAPGSPGRRARRHASEPHERDAAGISPAVLATLMTASTAAVFVADGRGRIIHASPGALEMFGYGPGELEGAEIESLIGTWDIAADLRNRRERGIGSAGLTGLEARRRDGSNFPVEIGTARIQWDGHRYVGIIMVDVSARVRADAALRESEIRTRTIIESLHEGVLYLAADGTVTANASGLRLLGLDLAQLAGQAPLPDGYRITSADGNAVDGPIAAAVDALRTAASTRDAQFAVHQPGGSVTWLSANVQPLRRDEEIEPYAVVVSLVDVTDRHRLDEELRRQALSDPLTGVGNRLLFDDRLAHALSGRPDLRRRVSLIFVDLDGFKVVNDELGHAAGDDLLRLVAARILSCVRDGDTVARVGGDEFAVILEGASEWAAADVAARIVCAVEAPAHLEGTEVRVGASTGIAGGVAGNTSAHDLFIRADRAMYRTKSTRRRAEAAQAAGRPEARAALVALPVPTQLD